MEWSEYNRTIIESLPNLTYEDLKELRNDARISKSPEAWELRFAIIKEMLSRRPSDD